MLKALKTQLQNSSYYSLVEKRLLWSAFTIAFYTFLQVGEFTDSSLQWSDVQSSPTTITIYLRQSKAEPFRCGQSIFLQATSTSTCPLHALNLFTNLIATRTGLLYCGGRFNPLSREQLTRALRMLLQFVGNNQHSYASHNFQIGAATTAPTAGLPAWLIKAMRR